MLPTILPRKAYCLAASSANVEVRSPGFLGPTEGKFKHQCGSDSLYVDGYLTGPPAPFFLPGLDSMGSLYRYSNC